MDDATPEARSIEDLGPIAPGSVIVLRNWNVDEGQLHDQMLGMIAEVAGHHQFIIVNLMGDQDLSVLTEKDMGRAGWVPAPSPGFPPARES